MNLVVEMNVKLKLLTIAQRFLIAENSEIYVFFLLNF